MRFHYSAAALALITTATLAEECPVGYAKAKGLTWTDCAKGENGSQLQCATIEVPKDWKDETSPKMKLHLVRQPAKTKSSRGERSVIINPGGPGSSGIQTVVEGGVSTQATLGDDLHLIGFDPRGVGLTIPYTCSNESGDDNKKTTRAVKEIEDQEGYYNTNVALADKCNKKEVDGALIGTAYVARDVKAIAESLGEDGLIRYIGYSYGTLLGATLAAMFPTKVDRIVLDGNINPQSYYHKVQTESAADTDSAIKHFFDLCATASKGSCAWAEDDKNGAQLTTKFDDFLDALNADQSNVVRDKFFMVLYDPSKFKAFASTLQGWKNTPSTIPARGATEKEKRDTFEVTAYSKINTPNAISAISCSDKITKLQGSPENYKKWLEEYRAVTKYGYDLSSAGDLQCSVWQTTAKERFDVPQSGVDTPNPILFVNTQYDPVTPMDSAVNSAKTFTKAVLLRSSGVGHCSNVNPSTDLNDAIREYMASGKTPKVTSYTPDKKNVFDEEEAEKAVTPGQPSKRNFRYPDFFSKRQEAATAEQIPAGCTKVADSSSAIVSPSASVASAAPISQSASLSASVSVSQSPEPTPAASPLASASVSESVILFSLSESASASVMVTPSASVSALIEPTPSVSMSVSASASASEVMVLSPSVSASLEPSPSVSLSIPASASASESVSVSVLAAGSASASEVPALSPSVSASLEPTPLASLSISASASASASESVVLSHSDSASVSVLVTPSVSVSESHGPTPSASLSIAASALASESIVPSHSESASVSVFAIASASVSVEAVPSPSASASESLVLSQPASASASVSVQQSSGDFRAAITPTISQSESYSVSPSASVSVHSESASVLAAQISSSVQHAEASPSASVSVAGEQGSQPSSAVYSAAVSADLHSPSASASVSASISVDYAATASSLQHSSYPAESLTPSASASATPIYGQDSAFITASASFSASSSAEHLSSSGLYLSSDIQVSQSASSYPPSIPSSSAYGDISSSVYPDSSSSAHVSSSLSPSYSVPVPSSSVPYPDTTVYPSSVFYSGESYYSTVSSSIVYYDTSIVHSTASLTGSYYPASTHVSSFGSSTPGSDYSKTKPHASSTPSKSADSSYPWPSSPPSYPEDYPADGVDYKGSFFSYPPAHSSSIPSYPKDDAYPGGENYPGGNAYPTGFYAVTTSGKPKGPKTTSAPCITVPWSSQPGYAPVTKTYTTTTVRTIYKCPGTVKECPFNSSTKTYITTETKTRTTVVATPSSPPKGNKSYPPNKDNGKSSTPPSKETSKVPSPPKDSSYPSQPAKPTSKAGQSPKETKPASPSPPEKDTGYPAPPSKPTGNSPQPPKQTGPIQSTHSAYAPPKISSPSVPTGGVPPYPTGPPGSPPTSVKVCNDMKCSYITVPTGTKPVVGTGASTTLKTSTPSASKPGVSVSVCVGKECTATGSPVPTGYKPAEFTGAASGYFVSWVVGAGAVVVAFAGVF